MDGLKFIREVIQSGFWRIWRFGVGLFTEVGNFFHPKGKSFHVVLVKAAGGDSRGAKTNSAGAESTAFIGGERISVEGEADFIEGNLVEFAIEAEAVFDVDKDKVVFGATALKDEVVFLEFGSESFGVCDNFGGVIFKIWLKSFTESYSFGGNNVFEWAALGARKDGAVNQDREIGDSFFRFLER